MKSYVSGLTRLMKLQVFTRWPPNLTDVCTYFIGLSPCELKDTMLLVRRRVALNIKSYCIMMIMGDFNDV